MGGERALRSGPSVPQQLRGPAIGSQSLPTSRSRGPSDFPPSPCGAPASPPIHPRGLRLVSAGSLSPCSWLPSALVCAVTRACGSLSLKARRPRSRGALLLPDWPSCRSLARPRGSPRSSRVPYSSALSTGPNSTFLPAQGSAWQPPRPALSPPFVCGLSLRASIPENPVTLSWGPFFTNTLIYGDEFQPYQLRFLL